MNDKLEQTLSTLTEKLGTTVAHLWEVLVRQAYLDALTGVVWAAASIWATVALARFVKAKTTPPPCAPGDRWQPRAEWIDETAVAFAWVGVGFAGLVALVITIQAVDAVLIAVFNPEFFALKQVLRTTAAH